MIITRSTLSGKSLREDTFDSAWLGQAKKDGELIFEGLIIEFTSGISHIKGIKKICFKGCTIHNLNLGQVESNEFSIDQSSTIHSFHLKNAVIDDFSLHARVSLDTQSTSSAIFYNCNFLNFILESHLNELKLENCFVVNASIKRVKTISFRHFSIGKQWSSEMDCSIYLENIDEIKTYKFEEHSLSIVDCNAILSLLDSHFKSLIFDRLIILGDSIISKCEISDEFNVMKSELNKLKIEERTTFLNCSSIIDDSEIENVILRNAQLPLKLVHKNEEENLRYYKQLLNVAKSANNITLIENYRKEIHISNFNLRKEEIKGLTFGDQFDFFFTSRIPFFTSRFNFELWRPISIFILIHLLLNLITIIIIWKPIFYESTFF